MRTLLLPAALAVVVGAGPCSAPARATFPGRNGLIAFSAPELASVPGIVAIRPDGSGRQYLTRRDANEDSSPVPSPDGQRIAFVRSEGSDFGLYVISPDGTVRRLAAGEDPSWSPAGTQLAFLDGGSVSIVAAEGIAGVRVLAKGDLAAGPSWSPDGSQIAFLDPSRDLLVVRPDGSGARRIAEGVSDASSQPMTWSPDGQRLAFAITGGEGDSLYAANADGSGLALLAHASGRIADPRWSPDGARIAFTRFLDDSDVSEVDVFDLASGQPRTLVKGARFPVWSANGQRLAYLRRHQLWVVGANGSTARQVTHEEPTSDIGEPAWSPDGRLLFAHIPGRNAELLTIDAWGGRPRRLTHNYLDDVSPAWSPDGKRIAFARVLHGRSDSEIYVMRADGTGVHRLTRHPGADTDPAWSPDGRRIAFIREVEPGPDAALAVLDLKSDRVHILARPRVPEGEASSPSWSPDGRRIVFSMDTAAGNRLWVIHADGAGLRRLTAHHAEGEDEWSPDWSPDGRRIVFVLGTACGGQCEGIDLATVRPNGTHEQDVRGSYDLEAPRWSPDGKVLLVADYGPAILDPQSGKETKLLVGPNGLSCASDQPCLSWQPLPRR